jgi:o-succinylbenzoate synthase
VDLTQAGFRISLVHSFRGHRYREGVLLGGPQGWGEYSPLPGYSDGAEHRCLRAAIASACERWPKPERTSVPVHVTVPALSPGQAAAMVRSSGCSAAKVKVAEGDDEARVEAVRDALGPTGRIVIDANGAWDLDQARRALKVLGRYGIELAEQPVSGLEELARLRRLIDIPVAADESVNTVDAAIMAAKLNAADVLVVKVQVLGGVHEAMRAVEASGLPAIVSSMLETSVGVSAGLALAAALPELPYPCGLGVTPFLVGDVVKEPLVPVKGILLLRRPEVDAEALRAFASPARLPTGDGMNGRMIFS